MQASIDGATQVDYYFDIPKVCIQEHHKCTIVSFQTALGIISVASYFLLPKPSCRYLYRLEYGIHHDILLPPSPVYIRLLYRPLTALARLLHMHVSHQQVSLHSSPVVERFHRTTRDMSFSCPCWIFFIGTTSIITNQVHRSLSPHQHPALLVSIDRI
jgi:hypothetical protein